MKIKVISLLLLTLFFSGCQSQQASQEITPIEAPESVQSQEVLEDLEENVGVLSQTRDEKRLSDIKSLQNALELYQAENSSYPNSLEELDIILPVNPTPGGKDYVYTPIGSLPAQYYDLCFTLEEEGDKCVNP